MNPLEKFDASHLLYRVLEDANNATDDTDDTTNESSGLSDGNDAQVLRGTLRVYGSFFIFVLILFSYLRRKFPRVYNLRSWVTKLKTPLATEKYGFFSWLWKVFLITDSDMMDECGMDALCYARVLEFGLRLSLVGMLNAVWLIPVYYTAEESPETDYITDPVVSISVSHLPSGSYRFCATVVGAYVIFGFAMYSILKEFQWFIMFRNQFLSKKLARNYSVYVRNIPVEYCSNSKFLNFFQQSSSGAVLEARLAIKAPNLKKLVAKRQKVIAALEHKINVEEVSGKTPMHRSIRGPAVNAVDARFEQLQELNQSISESIQRIERQNAPRLGIDSETVQRTKNPEDQAQTLRNETAEETLGTSSTGEIGENTISSFEGESEELALYLPNTPHPTHGIIGSIVSGASHSVKSVSASVKSAASSLPASDAVVSIASGAVGLASSAINNVADSANALLFREDGKPHNAGFVTFTTLRAAQAGKQLVQYSEPFAMEVLEAPQPEDVFWTNVGKTHHELQVGKLLSFGLTTVLCLLWTIPMSTIATMSSIEGLREFEFIANMLEVMPWLEPLLAQLAPLLIVGANEVLKRILQFLSMFEGPVSGAVVEAATFSKLASFMIIQTFFVSAVSGSILSSLSNILQEPASAIDLLANSLPTQSTFFIQVLLVDTFVSLSMELLRVVPIVNALIRSGVGPRLTQKEKETRFLGIRPLADPLEFEHASLLAGTVLYFMVYFVYASIAPITTFFMGICFLVMGAGYRHQFIYIYPTFPDSGGKLWAAFFKIVPICMIIAEITIVGFLALKKSPVASAMMFPLLVITILFYIYINQQHFRMTEYLPARDCLSVDRRNVATGEMDYGFLEGKYCQPELREREAYPENVTLDREVANGMYGTPKNSAECDIENDIMNPEA